MGGRIVYNSRLFFFLLGNIQMKLKFYKLLYKVVHGIGRFFCNKADNIYYKKLACGCYSCNGSGLQVGYENNTSDCDECGGWGHIEF